MASIAEAGYAATDRATTALPAIPLGVAEEGAWGVDDDRAAWLRAVEDVADGVELLLDADRWALTCCGCTSRFRDFAGLECDVDGFADLTAAAELESGELEPEFGAESSAAAIPCETVRATPTPAVTAPT